LLPELIYLHPRHCKEETANGAVNNGPIFTEVNAGGVPEGMRLIDRELTSPVLHGLRNLHEILIPSLGLPYPFRVIVKRLMTTR
jgi:hypothetical protein